MKLQQGALEFHLQGQHDQKSHGGGGIARKVVEAVESEYEAGTIERAGGETVTTGYMVGMGNKIKGTLALVSQEDFNVETVRNWLKRSAVKEAFKDNKVRAKIGVWVQNGKVYMEPSEQFVNKTLAVKAGTSQGENSIFHLDTFIEIPTSKQALDDLEKNIGN